MDSYGFRPERRTGDAIEQLFIALARKGSAQWVLEGDITSCFDEISHQWMLQNVCTDTKVLERWLKAGFVEEGKLYPTTTGCPQGGIISPVAANTVLDGLEELLRTSCGSPKNKLNFVRYADDFVIRARWHWARRRHRKKKCRWIYDRYFHKIGDRNGVFNCNAMHEDGSASVLCLRKAADVRIKRHVKIQAAATPFDPSYEEYFEKRHSIKMENSLAGHHKLLYIWTQQRGLCPICTERITTETGWHLHHLVRRTDGGSDKCSNLCLLHPVCHMQGHSQGFKFVLPVGPENPI